MKKNIQAVLLDLDGTLYDSQELVLKAFHAACSAHGLPFPTWNELMRTCRGLALREEYQLLTGLENVEHLCEAHRMFQENNMHLVNMFPGVRETLTAIKEMEIRMAIVTNRGDAVYETLEHARLTNFFETIRHTENTRDRLHKPHPQMLLDALEYMRVEPSSAMMVGDMHEDIEAGKAANVKVVVGVSYGFTGPGIAEHNPDYVIDDIRDLLKLLT